MQDNSCRPDVFARPAEDSKVGLGDHSPAHAVADDSRSTYSAIVCSAAPSASPPSSPNTGYQTVELDRNKK